MAAPSKPLGLIAGAGELPLLFAREAREKGFSLRTLALRGAAPKSLEALSDEIEWISIGQLGKLLSFFKKNGVRRAVMQGKVQHASLLKDPRLDFRAFALLARVRDRSGETLLKALAGELSKHHVRILDARFLMEKLLAPAGCLTSAGPGWEARRGIAFGLQKARSLARLGIGQTIAVRKGAVVAVEGVEGTDEAILRAGKWAGPGVILVKAASPGQDWRFDVPTIGPGTIRTLARAKAAGIALEARRCFLLDREKTLALAERNGLFVTAVP